MESEADLIRPSPNLPKITDYILKLFAVISSPLDKGCSSLREENMFLLLNTRALKEQINDVKQTEEKIGSDEKPI